MHWCVRLVLPAVVHATLLVDLRLFHGTAAEKAYHRNRIKQLLQVWNYLLRACSLVRQHQYLSETQDANMVYTLNNQYTARSQKILTRQNKA